MAMFAGTEYQCESYRLDEASKTIDAMMQIVDRKQAMKVDGVLVGGASLDADEFSGIARFQKHIGV